MNVKELILELRKYKDDLDVVVLACQTSPTEGFQILGNYLVLHKSRLQVTASSYQEVLTIYSEFRKPNFNHVSNK